MRIIEGCLLFLFAHMFGTHEKLQNIAKISELMHRTKEILHQRNNRGHKDFSILLNSSPFKRLDEMNKLRIRVNYFSCIGEWEGGLIDICCITHKMPRYLFLFCKISLHPTQPSVLNLVLIQKMPQKFLSNSLNLYQKIYFSREIN